MVAVLGAVACGTAARPTSPAPQSAAPPVSRGPGPGVWGMIDGPPTQDRVSALMGSFATALGTDCGHCHVEADKAAPTRNKMAAQWMAEFAVGLRLRGSAQVARCETCHGGRARLIPSFGPTDPHAGAAIAGLPDRDAIEVRMRGFNRALGVDCDHCHDTADYSRRTPNRDVANWMQANLVDRFDRADGTRLDCEACHRGRAVPWNPA